MNHKKILLFTLLNVLVIISVLGVLGGKPKVTKFNKIEFLEKKGDSIAVLLYITIENPNFFSISGKHITIESKTAKGTIGTGKIDAFSLDPKASDSLKVIMMVNANQMIDSYKDNADHFESTIALHGDFFPLFFTHKIDIDSKIPKKDINALLLSTFLSNNNITFDSLNYKPISPVESKLNFNINVKNTLNFEFKIQNIDVELYPSEKSQIVLGNWKLKKEVTMPPNKEAKLEGTLNVHHIAMIMAGVEKAGKELNKAFIKGKIMVKLDSESITVPFNMNVSTDMTKLKIDSK